MTIAKLTQTEADARNADMARLATKRQADILRSKGRDDVADAMEGYGPYADRLNGAMFAADRDTDWRGRTGSAAEAEAYHNAVADKIARHFDAKLFD